MSAYKNFSDTTKKRAKLIISLLIKYHFNTWEVERIKGFSTELVFIETEKGRFTYLLIKTTTKILNDYINLNVNEKISDKTLKIIINRLEELSFIRKYYDKKNVKQRTFEVQIEHEKNFNLKQSIAHFDKEWDERKASYLKHVENRLFDLQSAPEFNPSNVFGRHEEQDKITNLILNQSCKLVAILGEGGIGKTTLALKIANNYNIRNHFKYILWRSLLNAPPVTQLLSDIVGIISRNNTVKFQTDLSKQIDELLQSLNDNRCMLILDNVDQDKLIKSGGDQAYLQLFEKINNTSHKSCLLITSRELSKNIEQLDYIETFKLDALNTPDCIRLINTMGSFNASEKKKNEIVTLYRGNPYILQIIGRYILSPKFLGNIDNFLAEDIPMNNKILTWLLSRLLDNEKEIIYWLAISRESISVERLQEYILSEVSKNSLSETLVSIQNKLPIEYKNKKITVETFFLEYVREQIINDVSYEISNKNPNIIHTHALIQAEAKDYIRDSQFRLIIRGLVDTLVNIFGNEKNVEIHLHELLESVREDSTLKHGYIVGNIINILRYLKSDFNSCDFSALTIRQAYLQNLNLHNVNMTNANIIQSFFTESFDYILSVSFRNQGDLLAAGDANGQIHLWQLSTNDERLTIDGHENYVRQVIFSNDGLALASASSDSTIKVWSVETGQCLNKFSDGINRIWSLAFSPDDKYIATAGSDHLVKIWDLQTGECRQQLVGHENAIKSVVFSPDGNLLASAGDDKTIRFWDFNTGKCLRSIEQNHQLWAIAFHPKGKVLASSDEQGHIKLWNIKSGTPQLIISGNSKKRKRTIAFSDNGKTLISGGDDYQVMVWDVGTGECLKKYRGHTKWIWSVAFNKDKEIVASGSEDQTIRLWDINSGQCFKTLHGYKNLAARLVFSPDACTLASSHQDRNIYLWNYHTGNIIRTFKGHLDTVGSLEFSQDGQLLASGSKDSTIKLWDIATNRCLKTLRGHQDQIWAVAFGQDKRILASGSNDCTVRIWDTQSGQCQQILEGHKSLIWSVAVSPNSEIVASGSDDGEVKLWQASTGEYLRTLKGQTGKSWILLFSLDGNKISCSSGEQIVNTWDVETGELLNSFSQPVNQSWTACFSPNKSIIANATGNEIINIWNSETEKLIKTLEEHTRPIWTMVFDYPHGDILASSSWDDTIKIWNINTGKCLRTLHIPRPYEGMIINGIKGLTEAQKSTLISLGASES